MCLPFWGGEQLGHANFWLQRGTWLAPGRQQERLQSLASAGLDFGKEVHNGKPLATAREDEGPQLIAHEGRPGVVQ